MSTAATGLDKYLLELGWAVETLMANVDLRWFIADEDSRLPEWIANDLGTVTVAVQQIAQSGLQGGVLAAAQNVAAAARTAWDSFNSQWQNDRHLNVIRLKEVEPEFLTPDHWEAKSLLHDDAWQDLRRELTVLAVTLPDSLAFFLRLGRAMARVQAIGPGPELEPRFGGGFPIQELAPLLCSLVALPTWQDLDVDLNESRIRVPGWTYVSSAQHRVQWLFEEIRRRLMRVGETTEGTEDHQPAADEPPLPVTPGRDEVHQPAVDEPRPPETPVMEVENWEELGIGIDADGSYLAVSPCPAFGEVFPREQSQTLDLRGDRWQGLLENLARSVNGNEASKRDMLIALRYARAGQLSSKEAAEDALSIIAPAFRKLGGAMSDLGREIRGLVTVRDAAGEAVISAKPENVVRSRFVVRHLHRDGNGRLRFGGPGSVR
jgi:hypothetical protein